MSRTDREIDQHAVLEEDRALSTENTAINSEIDTLFEQLQQHYDTLSKNTTLLSAIAIKPFFSGFTAIYNTICDTPLDATDTGNHLITKSLFIIQYYYELLNLPSTPPIHETTIHKKIHFVIMKIIQTPFIHCGHISSLLSNSDFRHYLSLHNVITLINNLITLIETPLDNDPTLADIDISFILQFSQPSRGYENEIMPQLIHILNCLKEEKILDETIWATYFLKITEHFPQPNHETLKLIAYKEKCNAAAGATEKFLSGFLEKNPHLRITFNSYQQWHIDFGIEKAWSPNFLMRRNIEKTIAVKTEFETSIEKIISDNGGSDTVRQAVDAALQRQFKLDAQFVFV